MTPDDQPAIQTAPPHGSHPSSIGWQAPSVEQMQELLPQYEIMEILGRGGMGAVYKGRQRSLRRLVAIKILPPDAADDEMKFVERFQNEAQTMAAMNHPAIVTVYDFGETKDGLLYFVMEFVDGTDLQKMIQASGKLSEESALAIMAHVCDALQYAHSRGVIHRDIKPANIFINQEGHVKVGDFGLAMMDNPSMTCGLTKMNMAMGTPDYVAPEVLTKGMVADHRADIYAVGVMLYQMLTGEVPRGMFKLPSQKGIGSDPRFDEIICKAMEQDRNERYQSAGDVRRALDVILTTPQAKNDGTGVVKAKDIPQKPVAKATRPSGDRGGAAQNLPHRVASTADPAHQATLFKSKTPPKEQSAAALWLSIGGVVAVLGISFNFLLGSKTNSADDLSNASTFALPTAPRPRSMPHAVVGLSAATKDAPFENSLGMKFVPVPGTEVLFCIHETRYRDYAEFADKATEGINAQWKIQTKHGFEIERGGEDHPVTQVSWDDARAFCTWLSEKEGKIYRLPTDREWSLAVGIGNLEEWAADTTPATVFKVPNAFPWGAEWPPRWGAGNYSDESRRVKAPRGGAKYLDRYDDGHPTTAPVMSFEANKLGLFDLGGNVWEWVEDWNSEEQKDRVSRGGSWGDLVRANLLSSYRLGNPPDNRNLICGFRIVLEIAAHSPPPSAAIPSVSPPSDELAPTDHALVRAPGTD